MFAGSSLSPTSVATASAMVDGTMARPFTDPLSDEALDDLQMSITALQLIATAQSDAQPQSAGRPHVLPGAVGHAKRCAISHVRTPPPESRHVRHGQGCSRREGTLEAAPEAVRQVAGGGCQSGWGRLLSVNNFI